MSIVIPAYNEAAFIARLLERIADVRTDDLGFSKEVIVVDDGSTDGTGQVASRFTGVRVIRQHNQGKGSAVQRGVQEASGGYILVQDADLEYDPQDIRVMLQALPPSGLAAVYGSRVLGVLRRDGWNWPYPGKTMGQGLGPWIANIVLSLVTFLLFGRWVTDMLTGYKVYPTRFLRSLVVRTRGFETDHELSAKLFRAGATIVEVPVSYVPRAVDEGKKIRAWDGIVAIWTLLRFRFQD